MKRVYGSCLLLVVACVAGCGGGGASGGATTYPATGTVELNGQPLSGATVIFSPVGDQPTATATTDDQGNYTLQTYDFGDGAAAGSYKVTISKSQTPESDGGDALGDDEHAEDTGEHSKDGGSTAQELVQAKYTNASTTPLTAEVKADGENVFPFKL